MTTKQEITAKSWTTETEHETPEHRAPKRHTDER